MMLVIAMLTLLAVLVFAIGERSPNVGVADLPPGLPRARRRASAPAFSTGDLFHLFVVVRDPADGELRAAHPRRRRGAGPRRHDLRGHQHDRVGGAARRRSGSSTPRPARSAWPSCRRGSPRSTRGLRTGLQLLLLVAFGLKAAVFPLFFWLPGLVPDGAQPGHRGVRRAAHQDRRVRDRAHPDAAVRRRAQHAAAVGRRADDGRRRARRDRPERRQADPVVPHRQPDRLHGVRHRHRRAGRRSPRRSSSCIHQIPIKTSLFLVDGHDRARRPAPAASTGSAAWRTARASSPRCSSCRRSACRASRRSPASSPSSAWSPPASTPGRACSSAVAIVVQPADAGVDDEDLAVGVLGRAGAGGRSPASVGAAQPRRPSTRGRVR